jgi:nucleoid DNA-binding protein/DNA-directed RNA polymerase subunit RPC12/RpoP
MEEAPKKRAYTKSRLIKELAFRAGISQRQSCAALEAIIEIAYREARTNYFILPGLCKFDVVRRAPRAVRNPKTGEKMMLPERDALRVVLSKRAKETIVPHVAPLTEAAYAALVAEKSTDKEATGKLAEEDAARKAAEEEIRMAAEEEATRKAAEEAARKAAEEEAARKAAEEEAARKAVEEEAVRKTAEATQEPDPDGFIEAAITEDNAISFKCTTCGQEVIAPSEAVGYEAECPACGAILLVPSVSEPGTTYAKDGSGEQKEVVSVQEIEDLNPNQLKSRTIRIDALMFDEEINTAPSAGNKTSDAMKGRTMRIDLPDEF